MNYQPARGSVSVSPGVPALVTVQFVPVVSPTQPGPTASSLPTWAVGVGIAFLLIGATGLAATAYRIRSRRLARGRALVDRLSDGDWELGEAPELGPKR